MTTTRRDLLTGLGCFAAAGTGWVAAAPWVFGRSTGSMFDADGELPDWALALVERHCRMWEQGDGGDISLMRSSNPEWDFMGRTFLVLALANLALRRPADAPRYLAVIDKAIADTLEAEAWEGMHFFLLSYSRVGRWHSEPDRSLFVDGEIAAMMAAYELVAPGSRYRPALAARLELVARQMREGPVLSGESYPDECWTFCNTTALAALRMGEAAGISVDRTLPDDWVAQAKHALVSDKTGLLVSSYRWDGTPLDGPEGSSLWMSLHNLLLVDPVFARQQYSLARDELGSHLLGFGYAKEWPASERNVVDVDSGPVVPVLDASPGSSGLAVLGARAFGDERWYRQLLSSLELAAFPEDRDGALRYRASNQVGDAVLAYAACFGPLWQLVNGRIA